MHTPAHTSRSPRRTPRRGSAAFTLCLSALTWAAACSNAPPDDGSEDTDGGVGGDLVGGGGTPTFPGGGHEVPVGGQGGPGGGGPPPTGGDTPPTGGQATGGHGGDPFPTGGTGGDPPPVGGSGGQVERPGALIAAVVLTETPQIPQATANASVTEPIDLPSSPGCTAVQVNPNAPPAAAARGYDAGAITVTGANANLVFQPSAGANGVTYTAGGVPQDIFNDGAMLTAQAAGGPHLGAFSVQVQAPQSVNITEPRQQIGSTIDANGSVSVRWNAGNAESLLITVIPTDFPDYNPQAGTWVFCGVPDNGSFDIPAGTLGPVAAGADFLGQPALVTITRTKVGQTQVGPDRAVITASTTQAVPVALSN